MTTGKKYLIAVLVVAALLAGIFAGRYFIPAPSVAQNAKVATEQADQDAAEALRAADQAAISARKAADSTRKTSIEAEKAAKDASASAKDASASANNPPVITKP